MKFDALLEIVNPSLTVLGEHVGYLSLLLLKEPAFDAQTVSLDP
jgi:hypothetical protein